jgi:DNA-binding transcriptional LysR family regulator
MISIFNMQNFDVMISRMKRPDPLSLDFAALRTLHLVFRLGSFSAAAEALDVNQSTISYTIDRLRKVFHDPLFVRQGGGVAATDRCREIVEAAGQMLDEFEALAAPARFDPAASRDSVTISCNYYERVTLIPALVKALRRAAPGMRLNLITAFTAGKQHLKNGEADLLIGPVKIEESGFYRRPLLKDHYVCVMDPPNPLAGAALDLDAFADASHAVVTYGGNWRSQYLVELEALGRGINQVLGVPSPSDLPNMLAGTDLISTVPSRVAASFGAALHVAPCPLPAPFEIDLCWTARTHHSAMQKWLRELIADTAATLYAAA